MHLQHATPSPGRTPKPGQNAPFSRTYSNRLTFASQRITFHRPDVATGPEPAGDGPNYTATDKGVAYV
jgi:hypothetical protein